MDENEDTDLGEIVWDRLTGDVDIDHELSETPIITLRMGRGEDTMLLSGYPQHGLIVSTVPARDGMCGVITELPVGWQALASAETFLAHFEKVAGSYRRHGWKAVL